MKVMGSGLPVSAPLAGAAAVVLLLTHRPGAALVLTLSFLTAIISGLWLEHVLWQVLQPGRPRLTRPLFWQAAGRMGFLAGAFAVLFVYRRQVELWAVALGLTLAVVGWTWAGVRSK
ncbi:MAG: hypothetical protein ACOY7U_05120 [Acidobacteriota bacterium]|uniref:Uncharacterized protein n=1 Tax=Thermoanaerobaculum aquaticum TaxID=1312852 RepID=A0A062XKR1_9BACT|nr:hypothetical protein [Thermoanaerobaculum aquaticum]KDA53142.1 hypothetical protein EG19_07125 [Thermoanaerobaculum aquaticum]GBC79178.1 hypothetical protein HRbin09_00392 [bacterium HR09]